ncbi:MAG: ribonuclease HI [Clostridiales bacterium]|nr:ribonuclease HI [Clostridiales bacterium]
MLKKVEIWTDGACSGNPGPGGWAAILNYKGIEKVVSGGLAETTNNVMELTAVVEALNLLKEKCEVCIYSDSTYVVSAITEGWLDSWLINGFKTTNKKPVKNRELWEALHVALKKHKVSFVHVKGHADNVNNNRCDKIAREEVQKFTEVPF